MKSIRTKLIISTLSIAAAIAIVLSVICISAINLLVTNSFNSFLKPLAKESSITVTTTLKSYSKNLETFTTQGALTNPQSDESVTAFL